MDAHRITPAPLPARASHLPARTETSPSHRGGDGVRRLAAVPVGLVLDPLRVTVFLLTLITVSRVHQHYRFIAAVRPGVLLMLAAGAIVFLSPKSVGANIFSTRPARLVAIF